MSSNEFQSNKNNIIPSKDNTILDFNSIFKELLSNEEPNLIFIINLLNYDYNNEENYKFFAYLFNKDLIK